MSAPAPPPRRSAKQPPATSLHARRAHLADRPPRLPLRAAATAISLASLPAMPRFGERWGVGAATLEFELEITDLRHPSPDPLVSPLERRTSSRQRAGHLLLCALLLLLLLPALAPTLPARVAVLLAPASASAYAQSVNATRLAGAVQSELLRDPRWATLAQRTLHLPLLTQGASCPVVPARVVAAGLSPALGSGPAYAIAIGDDSGALLVSRASALGLPGRDWGGQLVAWYFDPLYQGPILIRGSQLDGSGLIRFNGGLDQQRYIYSLPRAPLIPALRLEADSSPGTPWPGWPSYTRLRHPGCYAYQVDGLTFSEVIVFRAVFEPS